MSVRARIEHYMALRGLTRAELARRSGVSKGHITTLFQDAHPNPTLETLERLAYALDVPPVALLGEFPALLAFAHAEGLPFEDYLRLKEEVPDAEKPGTAAGWRDAYRRLKEAEYPGLAAYLAAASLRVDEVLPLIRSLQRRSMPLPNTAEGWEQQHRWFQAFPE
jgi:transcriptional regulator with XRE-family HTH domain